MSNFYDQLSKYYDAIFPAAKQTVKFLSDNLGEERGNILDVACGTGNYALALAKEGYHVTGVDLSKSMIQAAQQKAGKIDNVQFLQGDMRNLVGFEGEFQGAFCLGNSFVHLLSDQDMLQALNSIGEKLTRRGRLIIQIVNYDRILKFHITQLPSIVNDDALLTFERYYDFRDDGLIDFRTVLKVPQGEFENSVPLRPLPIDKLRTLLADAGFLEKAVYNGFDQRTDDNETLVTVVVAIKE